jgi:hypothetical protein
VPSVMPAMASQSRDMRRAEKVFGAGRHLRCACFVDMNRGEATVDGGYGARLMLLFSVALSGLAGCI